MKTTESSKYPPIIVIGGCTASGKNELAISLAKDFNGIIVNADSKQVFQELQIGTARPVPDTTKSDHWVIDGVKHYLYGYISLFEDYNLYRYQQDCLSILSNLTAPIFLVGGTGLYINAIIKRYNLKKQEDLSNLRKSLEIMSVSQLQIIAGKKIFKMNNSDKNNKRRLIRLIEKSQQPPQDQKTLMQDPLPHLYLIKDKSLEDLELDIVKRTQYMFESGLVEEVEQFKDLILNDEPKLKIIGYQEFKEYFENTIDLEHVKDLIILHTRQYTKRQRTWFRNQTSALKISDIAHQKDEIQHIISNFLTSVS